MTGGLDAAAEKLVALASQFQAHRSKPMSGVRIGALVLASTDDFPAETSEWKEARHRLTAFGEELFKVGGLSRMAQVLDYAIEVHGHRSVSGVSPAWDGVGGWWH